MKPRLWYMNADFEMELAAGSGRYRRPALFEPINRKLAERILWLASPGDSILLDSAPDPRVVSLAGERHVSIKLVSSHCERSEYLFSPWGWTPRMAELGKNAVSIVEHPDLEVVKTVNSKIWSFLLESQLNCAFPGSAVVRKFEELTAAVAHACPGPEDKWVIKSPFGFAARGRVLGRGPLVNYPQAEWARRQLTKVKELLFQPWLEVKREYGVAMNIGRTGTLELLGISDLQTNGAGTGIGYMLGTRIPRERLKDLEDFAEIVGNRLFEAGYYGPVGLDALEHKTGLLPILEINARYTMGFVALERERALKPESPTFWDTKIN